MLVPGGYVEARKILLEKQEEFERLAKGLLEYETLTGDEIRKVIAGEPLDADDDGGSAGTAGGTTSVTAIPKTKPRAPKGGGLPEPSA